MRLILYVLLAFFMSWTAWAQIIQRENGTTEQTLRWGAYTVKFFHYMNPALADAVQIRDQTGRVLREVRAERIVGPDFGPEFPILEDINGDGLPELRVLAWTGGAYCCYTEYFFDRRRGLRNILIFAGREYDSDKVRFTQKPFRDLGNTAQPEIILENDSISRLNGSTHGPTTALVLGWNGTRYVNVTRRFARLANSQALEYRAQIALDAKGHFEATQAALDQALGYYANALVAGDERRARAWLLEHGGPQIQAWLLEITPRIRMALRNVSCRVGQSQARLIYTPAPGVRVPGSGCAPGSRF